MASASFVFDGSCRKTEVLFTIIESFITLNCWAARDDHKQRKLLFMVSLHIKESSWSSAT